MAGQGIIYSSANYINKNSNINTECQNPFLTVWSKQNLVKQSSQLVFIVSSWICTSGKRYTQFRVEYTDLISSIAFDFYFQWKKAFDLAKDKKDWDF